MENIEVSVVIPAYNSEATIIEVLNSVKDQTKIEHILEIIIINDGSTDRTEEVIKRFCRLNPNLPIRYFHQPNKGVSAARNKGIKEAKGNYIALLDSDDLWYKDKLEKQINAIKSNPEIVFLGTGYMNRPFVRKGKEITTLYKADLFDIFWSFFPVTPSVIFRKSAIEKVGYFDENQKYCEDINYYLRFAIYYNYYYLPEKLVEIDIGKRYHGEKGLTSNLKGMHEGEMKNLKETYDSGVISLWFYIFFFVFLNLKYWRRIIRHNIITKKWK